MARYLSVFDGSAIYPVLLNVSERTEVYDEAGVAVQVLNAPDTTAALGGNLAVVIETGATVQVPYTGRGGGFPSVPVDEANATIGPTAGSAGQGAGASGEVGVG